MSTKDTDTLLVTPDVNLVRQLRTSQVQNIRNRDENDGTWKTCCHLRSDKGFIRFVATSVVSLIIIIFSCYQLSRSRPDYCKDSCDTHFVQLYTGLITLILGYYLPNPTYPS